jgi:hypothetical protein
LSDETGSWKIIWIRRRARSHPRASSAVMSVPSNTMLPEVGSTRRKIARPSVVLPDPDSPTRLKISPRSIENDTSSTATSRDAGAPLRRAHEAALTPEVLGQPLDLQQRLRHRGAPTGRGSSRRGGCSG